MLLVLHPEEKSERVKHENSCEDVVAHSGDMCSSIVTCAVEKLFLQLNSYMRMAFLALYFFPPARRSRFLRHMKSQKREKKVICCSIHIVRTA